MPIVPAAIIFDLWLGDPKARPDVAAGYQARPAASDGPVAEGSVGAGTGATVGKALGLGRATKGGLGTASTRVLGSYVAGVLVAVNAYGDVAEPYSGRILAGARDAGGGFADTARQLTAGNWVRPHSTRAINTTIGVVATNAPLTKDQANYLATMAQDGVALAVRPAHTMLDGDAIFALSVAEEDAVDPCSSAPSGPPRCRWWRRPSFGRCPWPRAWAAFRRRGGGQRVDSAPARAEYLRAGRKQSPGLGK